MSGTTGFALADGTVVRPCNPFFIAGSGRCGTTLMRRLVVERTCTIIPPENYTLASSAHILARAGAAGAAPDWDLFCRLVLNDMQKSADAWEYFGIDADLGLMLLQSVPAGRRTVANFWHAFHAIYARQVNKPDSLGWGDKTPSNTAQLADIIGIFPQAKFIFMVRDVFDMAYSYGSTAIPGRTGYYLGGAKRWVHANHQILEFCDRYPAQVMITRYEDLARFTEREMARVLQHLDVPLRAARSLSLSEARDIVQRPHLGNVMGAVSGDFVGNGRSRLSDVEKQQISAVAEALQIRLGYEPTGATEIATRA